MEVKNLCKHDATKNFSFYDEFALFALSSMEG